MKQLAICLLWLLPQVYAHAILVDDGSSRCPGCTTFLPPTDSSGTFGLFNSNFGYDAGGGVVFTATQNLDLWSVGIERKTLQLVGRTYE